MKYQEELEDLGGEVFSKSDEYTEQLTELRKSATRERTAERRLSNRGTKKVLHRRKTKKIAGTARMEED